MHPGENDRTERSASIDDQAISPVIGVILMVAITVIMAAIIAAAVFAMPVQVQQPWKVGIDAKQVPGDLILVTVHGGGDYPRLDWINGSVNGDSAACNSGNGLSPGTTPPLSVGGVMQCTGATSSGDHLIITGHFNDQSDQVLIDTFL